MILTDGTVHDVKIMDYLCDDTGGSVVDSQTSSCHNGNCPPDNADAKDDNSQ
jgi:hypothetical protein